MAESNRLRAVRGLCIAVCAIMCATTTSWSATTYEVGNGKTYSTISGALSATPTDLTGMGVQTIKVYRNAINAAPWVYSDDLFISNSGGSSSDYIHIMVVDSNRHHGKLDSGVVLTPATGPHGIRIRTAHTRISGLQLEGWGTGEGLFCEDSSLIIEDMLIVADNTTSNGILLPDTSGTIGAIVRNCIIYNTGSHGLKIQGSTVAATIQNTTIYGCGGYGVNVAMSAVVEMQNVISMNCTNGDFYNSGSWATVSNNMSSDASAPGTGSLTNMMASNQFKNTSAGAEDFHLISGADAIDAGTDLSAVFDNDADGQKRSLVGASAWDMGADEFKDTTFTDIGSGVTGIECSDVTWGDYFNDGDLDILIAGEDSVAGNSKIYRNDGSGVFTDFSAAIAGVQGADAEWGDYDNDGDLDLAIAGYSSSGRITEIYRNDGAGTFTNIDAAIDSTGESALAWGDYDNDGDLDLLVTGYGQSSRIAKIYRNDGGGAFVDIAAGLTGVTLGCVAWGDYDNDGDLDIALTGYDGAGEVSIIYRNDGNGSFVDIGAGLTAVDRSSIDWGDYDADGDLDLVMAGNNSSSGSVAKVYRNDGNGTFVDIGAGMTGIEAGTIMWGDYDNDGDLDILSVGEDSNYNYIPKLYTNEGSDTFTGFGAGLTEFDSCAAWGDYDNDGDLDILGGGSGGYLVYRNNTATSNSSPASPTGLTAMVSKDSVVLSWSQSTDTETPQTGLTYNVYVGKSPAGCEVVSPMADSSTGFRKIVSLGNVAQVTSWTIQNVPEGKYYWSVQSIDNSFSASSFATEQSFTTGSPPDNDMTLDAKTIDTGAVVVSWNPSAIDSTDADSVGIWYKTADYPDSAYDLSAIAGTTYTLNVTYDTLRGFNPHTTYYFSLLVRDSAGNWSDTTITACDTAYTRRVPNKWKGTTNSDWSTASNWSTGAVPQSGDSVVFDSGAQNCVLSTWSYTGDMVFTSGYTGMFDFNGQTLEVRGGMADFRSGGTFTDSGSISTYTMEAVDITLIPPTDDVLPAIYHEKGVLTLSTNALKAKELVLIMGSFVFENVADTMVLGKLEADSLSLGSNVFKILHTLKIYNYSGVSYSTGANIVFDDTGSVVDMQLDSLHVSSVDTLPPVYHRGAAPLLISADSVFCAGFTSSGGTVDFNSNKIWITDNGMCEITGGTTSKLTGLTSAMITVSGDAVFSGKSGDSLLEMSAAMPWYLNVSGSLDAYNAVIESCDATSGNMGYAHPGCVDSGYNFNWTFMVDSVAPDNDMSLNATAIDTDAVVLSWNPSAIDSLDADSVGIWYKTGDYPDSAYDETSAYVNTLALQDSSDTVTGLSEKQRYFFSLCVRDSTGNWSDTSLSACDTARTHDKTLPVNVLSFFAVFDNTGDSIMMQWSPSASVDAESTMIRYRTDQAIPMDTGDGVLFASFAAQESTAVMFGPKQKLTYWFSAFVKDSAGNWCGFNDDASDSAYVRDTKPPDNTLTISATAIDTDAVDLSWNPSVIDSPDADSVGIWYRTDRYFVPPDKNDTTTDTIATYVGALPLSDSVYAVTGLSQKTKYYFTLLVRDSTGNASDSAASACGAVWTLDLSAPANVTNTKAVYDTAGKSVVLSWAPSVTADAESTMIRFRTDGSYPAGPNDGEFVSRLGALDSSETIAGVNEKEKYWCALFVKDSSGNWSQADNQARDTAYVPDYTFPSNVLTLVATAISVGEVELKWNPSSIDSLDADSVGIWYKTGDYPDSAHDESAGQMGMYALTDSVDTLSALNEKERYYFALCVRDSAGNWSDTAAAATANARTFDRTAPANVTGFVAVYDAGSDTVALKWTGSSSPDVEKVCIRFRTDGSFPVDTGDGVEYTCWNEDYTSATFGHPGGKKMYRFAAFAGDSSGNWSGFDIAAADSVYITDIHAPDNDMELALSVVGSNLVELKWNPGAIDSADAEMTGIFSSVTSSFTQVSSQVVEDSTLYTLSTNSDTITVLPDTTYYFGLSVRDSSGNWAAVSVDARDSLTLVTMRDSVALVNDLDISLSSVGDTAIQVRLHTGDSVHVPGIQHVNWGYSHLSLDTSELISSPFAYKDTTFMIYDVRTRGPWVFGFQLRDSAGYKSTTVFDTVTISNVAPILSAPADTTIDEDKEWLVRLSGYDANNDSLNFVLLSSTAITEITLSQNRLKWIPGQRDVGSHTLQMACIDTYGDSGFATVHVTVAEVNDPPSTSVKTQQSYGALRADFSAQDDKDTLFDFRYLLMRTLDSMVIDSGTIRAAKATRDFYPLTDGAYILSVLSRDMQGKTDSVEKVKQITIRNSTTHTFKGGSKWHMAGVPGKTLSPRLLSSGGSISYWDESTPPRDIYSYYVPSDNITSLRPGQGVWRRSDSSVTIDIKGSLIPKDSVCSITLHNAEYGWNQVTNPYPYPIELGGNRNVWEWDSAKSTAVPSRDTLFPWRAYWVQVTGETTCTFSSVPCYAQPQGLAKKTFVYYSDPQQWRIRFHLESPGGKDFYNVIGFSKKARDAMDPNDKAKPPAIGSGRHMFFYHPEWEENKGKYAQDIRGTFSGTSVFITGFSPSGNSAQLRVNGLEALSSVYIYLASSDTMVQIDADKPYTIPPSDEVVYRTIFVTDDADFMRRYPRHFRLGTAYPNPFGPMVQVSYTLPMRWEKGGILNTQPYTVRMNIMDSRGRVVRTLVYGKRKPGTYDIVWYGRTSSGNVVSSGVYFYKMNAGNYTGVKRMIKIK